jgi:FlaA1/EpsC-like NDP-sugar epimerase
LHCARGWIAGRAAAAKHSLPLLHQKMVMCDGMDASRIAGYFKGKSILITGSTGFLGKRMSTFSSPDLLINCIMIDDRV